MVISNYNGFRVLFDKFASVCFLWKIYLYFSIRNDQPREPSLCQLYRHTFVPYSTYIFDIYIRSWRRGIVVSGVRQWTKLTHVGTGYNWDGWPSSGGYTISGCNQLTRSTQPCIPPGSLNRVPASAGVKAGISPVPGGRYYCVIPYGTWVPVAVRLLANCYTPFTFTPFVPGGWRRWACQLQWASERRTERSRRNVNYVI